MDSNILSVEHLSYKNTPLYSFYPQINNIVCLFVGDPLSPVIMSAWPAAVDADVWTWRPDNMKKGSCIVFFKHHYLLHQQ